jgi:hypothetical protein
MEKNAAPTRNMTRLDPDTERERKRRNGTSGVWAALSWRKVKTASSTAAPPRIDKVYAEPQACVSVPTMA